MSDTQTAGAGTNEAGGTQTDTSTTQTAAGEGAQGNQVEGQQGEAKQGDATKPEDKAKTEGAKPADEVTFKAEVPEGVDLDQASLDEFSKIVKDPALSPSERAQKLVDLAIKREADRQEQFVQTVRSWADTVAADKELGNAENQAEARKVIDTFGTPELKALLNSTGMGNHPELVRFAIKIGKAMGEDVVLRSRGDAPAKARDPANVLYDKTPTA